MALRTGIYLLAVCLAKMCSSEVIIQVDLLSYFNPGGVLQNGSCCDTGLSLPCSSSGETCDPQFELCLESGDVSTCSTPLYVNNLPPNRNQLTASELPSNLRFTLPGSFPTSIPIKLIARDLTGSSLYRIIDVLQGQIPGRITASPLPLTLTGSRSSFVPPIVTLRYSAVCGAFSSGDGCRERCDPSRSCASGFYDCASDGSRMCAPGWKGRDCRTQSFPVGKCAAFESVLIDDELCIQGEILFLLDQSSRLTAAEPAAWQSLKDFVRYFVDFLTIGPRDFRISVGVFGNDAASISWRLDEKQSKSEMRRQLQRLTYSGGPGSPRLGLKLARETGFLSARVNVRRFVFVLTSSAIGDRELLRQEAPQLKNALSEVFVFARNDYSASSDVDIFRTAASEPVDNHFQSIANFRRLAEFPGYYARLVRNHASNVSCGPPSAGDSFLFDWTTSFSTCGRRFELTLTLHRRAAAARYDGLVAVTSPYVGVYAVTLTNDFTGTWRTTFGGWVGPAAADHVTLKSLRPSGRIINGAAEVPGCADVPVVLRRRGYCLNSGSCYASGLQAPSCCCPTGFSGDRCEVIAPRDPCSGNPCGSGTCRVAGNSYRCDCPAGVYGEQCQLSGSRIRCPEAPCLSNGTCPGVALDLNCAPCAGTACPNRTLPCAEFYHGANCNVYCRPQDNCAGHYQCSSLGVRTCLIGWIGSDCRKRDPRIPPPTGHCPAVGTCLNGAACFNGGCCCLDDYDGEYCENSNVPPLPCASDPCLNGGTCSNTQQGFVCNCPTAFRGRLCSEFCRPGEPGCPRARTLREIFDELRAGIDETDFSPEQLQQHLSQLLLEAREIYDGQFLPLGLKVKVGQSTNDVANEIDRKSTIETSTQASS